MSSINHMKRGLQGIKGMANPLPIKELINGETYKDEGDPPISPTRHLLETVFIPFIFIGLIVYYLPVLTISFLTWNGNAVIASLYFSFLAFLADFCIVRLAWLFHTVLAYRAVVRFIENRILDSFRLEEHDYLSNLPEEIKNRILAMRVTAYCSRHGLFAGFRMVSERTEKIAPQQKGSAIPISGARVEWRDVPASTIYLTDPPEDMTLGLKYALLHEIGHTTKYAWRRKVRTPIALFSVLFGGAFLLHTGEYEASSWVLICLLLLRPTVDWLHVFLVYGSYENLDESIADQFALACWQYLEKNLDSLERRRSGAASSAKEQSKSWCFMKSWRLKRRLNRIKKIFKYRADRRLRPLDPIFQAKPHPIVLGFFAVSFVAILLNAEIYPQEAWIHHIHYFLLLMIFASIVARIYAGYLYYRMEGVIECASQPVEKQSGFMERLQVRKSFRKRAIMKYIDSILTEYITQYNIVTVILSFSLLIIILGLIVFEFVCFWEYIPSFLTG